MNIDGKKTKTWLQCTGCGRIYQIPQEVSIEKLYIMTNCPTCGITKALNLGEQKEDIYYFYDVNMDNRYY